MSEHKPSSRSTFQTISRIATYIATNGTKAAGIYIGLREQQGEGREGVLLFAAVLLVGAQRAENIALQAIDRLFGDDGKSS